MPSEAILPRGVALEEITWVEAERILTRDAIVVLPIGSASKQHGPHLKLRTDWVLAQHLARRLVEREAVVVAPILGFHHYPAFAEYPGSISLRLETARDLTIDVVKSFAAHGPRRFYALNTGISTVSALEPAAAALAREGIVLHYTDLRKALAPIEARIAEQEGGTHADEIETSMLLAIDPASVDMSRATKDFDPRAGRGPLTRRKGQPGKYSPSGVWGDATRATREKGEHVLASLIESLVADIVALRAARVT
jgi:creatinine amidohydrolase